MLSKYLVLIALLWPAQLVIAQSEPDELGELLQRFQQMKDRLMNEFFGDDFFSEQSWWNDSFGLGTGASGLFQSSWNEVKGGQELVIEGIDSKVKLQFEIDENTIQISADKSDQGSQQTARSSMSIPWDLDGSQHKIQSTKDGRIVIFFPYRDGPKSSDSPMIKIPKKNEKEKTVPLIRPRQGDEVI